MISNCTVQSIGPRLVCFLLIVLLLVLTGVHAAHAEPQTLTGAKTEAATLEAQLKDLKVQAAVLRERYDYAGKQLAQTEADAAENADLLAHAQMDQVSAENALSDRLAHIYKQGRAGTLEILLTAGSFSELVDRVTLLGRIGKQDSDLVKQVTDYRARVVAQGAKLAAQVERQQAAAGQVDVAQQALTQKLAQAQLLLKGKEAEVAQLEKEWKAQQAQQARLEQERQARLQAALAAAQATAQAAGPKDSSGSGGSSTNGGGNGPSTTTTSRSTTSTTIRTTSTTGRTTSTTSGGGGGGGQVHNPAITNILKPEQIALVAQRAGFSGDDLVIAVAVAMGESHSDANAIGRLNTYGLWQILASAHPNLINPSDPDASRWYDPYVNARFAYKISGGKNWRAWSVYTSGVYQRYMDRARAGVDLLLGDPGSVVPPTAK